jgi:hypothetical protein
MTSFGLPRGERFDLRLRVVVNDEPVPVALRPSSGWDPDVRLRVVLE